MQRIALMTDSTCDIPLEWRTQYEITVIPLTIVFGEELYRDGVDITPEEFYERLPLTRPIPTTSQPAPSLFLEAYQQAAADILHQRSVRRDVDFGLKGIASTKNLKALDFESMALLTRLQTAAR